MSAIPNGVNVLNPEVQITEDQKTHLKVLVAKHGLAHGIFQPEGVGPYADLVVIWKNFGVVIHPTDRITRMPRIA
jgi:hypothetical protein